LTDAGVVDDGKDDDDGGVTLAFTFICRAAKGSIRDAKGSLLVEDGFATRLAWAEEEEEEEVAAETVVAGAILDDEDVNGIGFEPTAEGAAAAGGEVKVEIVVGASTGEEENVIELKSVRTLFHSLLSDRDLFVIESDPVEPAIDVAVVVGGGAVAGLRRVLRAAKTSSSSSSSLPLRILLFAVAIVLVFGTVTPAEAGSN
jgi:hypothetical protein